jgi:hypothetical protein
MVVLKDDGGQQTYTPHSEGQFAAVCVDVVDLGWLETKFGLKHKIELVYYCGEGETREFEDGKRYVPFTVRRRFTGSMHEKSNLRAFIKAWRGKDFTKDELADGFDFERMLGAPAFIQVEHNEWEGKTFANIITIMKLPKGMEAPDVPDTYVRVKDREGYEGPAPHPNMSKPEKSLTEPDDDLPF